MPELAANPFGRWQISPAGRCCGHLAYLLILPERSRAYLLTRRSFRYRWYTGEHLLN